MSQGENPFADWELDDLLDSLDEIIEEPAHALRAPAERERAFLRALLPDLTLLDPPRIEHQGRASRSYRGVWRGEEVWVRLYRPGHMERERGTHRTLLAQLEALVAPTVGIRVQGAAEVLFSGGNERGWAVVERWVPGQPHLPSPYDTLALAEGCGRLHAAGIIHGGLRPSRLLRDAEGNWHLVGVGWAAFVASGQDPRHRQRAHPGDGYLAPEQLQERIAPSLNHPRLEGAVPSPATDVFALGALAYQALAGQPPFGRTDAPVSFENVVRADYRRLRSFSPPVASDPLSRVVEQALRPLPGDRFPDANHFAQALSEVLAASDELAPRRRFWELGLGSRPYEPTLRERVRREPEPFLAGLPYHSLTHVHDFAAGALWRAEGPEGRVALRLYAPAPPPLPLFEIDVGQALDRWLEEGRGSRAASLVPLIAARTTPEGVRLLIERWIEGEPLMRANPTHALHGLVQLASSLGQAHRLGMVHGGIRPSRLLLDPWNMPWLVGWGWGAFSVALLDFRLGYTPDPRGLPHFAYRSPEQVAGVLPDARSDVFSLGTLLFELLAGRPLFTGLHLQDLGDAIRTQPRPLQGLAPEYQPILARALDPLPSRRYPDALALADALTPLLS